MQRGPYRRPDRCGNVYGTSVDGVLINFRSKLNFVTSLFLDSFMCHLYTSTDMRPQSLLQLVIGKHFDEGVYFELRKKVFDEKSGFYTYITLHFPLPLWEIEERVSKAGYEVLQVMTRKGKIRFKRHNDCETECKIYS